MSLSHTSSVQPRRNTNANCASSEKAFHNYILNFKFLNQNPSPNSESQSHTSKKCLTLQSNPRTLSTHVVAPISHGMSTARLCVPGSSPRPPPPRQAPSQARHSSASRTPTFNCAKLQRGTEEGARKTSP